MIEEDSSLDDDVSGMLERVSKQHHEFRQSLGEAEPESIGPLAVVEIAHQLAFANVLKGLELLIQLESEEDEDDDEEDEDEDE